MNLILDKSIVKLSYLKNVERDMESSIFFENMSY